MDFTNVPTKFAKNVKEVKNTGSCLYYAGCVLMVDEFGRFVDGTYVNHYGAQILCDAIIEGRKVAIEVNDPMGTGIPYFVERETGYVFEFMKSNHENYRVEETDGGTRWVFRYTSELKG